MEKFGWTNAIALRGSVTLVEKMYVFGCILVCNRLDDLVNES